MEAFGFEANNLESEDVSMKVEDLPDFDVAEMLDSEEAIAEFLNDFLDEEDPAMLAHALGIAARAQGMTEVARKAGVTREGLYKALRPDSAPRMDTIMKVLKAFGMKLAIQPIESKSADVTHEVGDVPFNSSAGGFTEGAHYRMSIGEVAGVRAQLRKSTHGVQGYTVKKGAQASRSFHSHAVIYSSDGGKSFSVLHFPSSEGEEAAKEDVPGLLSYDHILAGGKPVVHG